MIALTRAWHKAQEAEVACLSLKREVKLGEERMVKARQDGLLSLCVLNFTARSNHRFLEDFHRVDLEARRWLTLEDMKV